MRRGALLFQTDEMDGMLRQINADRECKRESIPTILLTLYTSAADFYPVRTKANQKEDVHIDQPHVTLFGTATPQYFYESLSMRMLTNGFFARMIIIDIGARGQYQRPGSTRPVPESIRAVAQWWDEFQPGTHRKNLLEMHPEPQIVPYTADADAAAMELQQLADAEYNKAHERNDEMARVVWSRTSENAKKLALIYAVSNNHLDPDGGPARGPMGHAVRYAPDPPAIVPGANLRRGKSVPRRMPEIPAGAERQRRTNETQCVDAKTSLQDGGVRSTGGNADRPK